MTGDRAHPFRRDDLWQRGVPFVAVMLLPYLLLPFHSGGTRDTTLLLTAAGLNILIVIAVPLVPWGRRPRADASVPPLAYLAVVALLRQGDGGAAAAYSVLVFLPVLWFALYGTRVELFVGIAGVALTLGLPIVLEGAPKYPDTDWERMILLTALTAFTGLVAQGMVRRVRERATAQREATVELEDAVERQRQSRTFLRAVMASAAEGFIVLDPKGRTEFVNPSAASMLGYEPDQLLDRPLHAAIHHTKPDGSPYPAVECPVRGSLLQGETHEVRDEVFWRKDGASFPVEYRSTPIHWGSGPSGVVVTFVDITERREIERMKDEFVSVVGHELRTPLTSIRGSLGLMAGGVYGELSEDGRRMLEIAVTNTDRLVRLINEILDIERIESGRAPMVRRLCDLADILREAEELMAPTAAEAEVELSVEGASARLWADADRVLQTVTNLLSNAVKFSQPGGAVALHAEVRGEEEVVVSVTDRGRGIPPKMLETIFERFAQVDASDSREKGGTGLGLSIARSIVNQHGGRIWAESEPGQGSTFSFALPLVGATAFGRGRPRLLVSDFEATSRAHAAQLLRRWGYAVTEAASGEETVRLADAERPAVILVDAGSGGDAVKVVSALEERDSTRGIPVVIVGGQAAGEGDDSAQPWVSKPLDPEALAAALERVARDRPTPRALIVEDDIDLARVLIAIFERHGLHADHAPSAAEALRQLEAAPPDLLVLDLILPDGDGGDVVEWLRARDEPTMPIVVYTARDLDAEARERLTLGETEFLTKSRVSPDEFERRVVDVVDRLSADRPEQ